MASVRVSAVALALTVTGALALGGCPRRSGPSPAMSAPPAVMTGMPVSLAYTVMPGIPTWSTGYSPVKMQDNNPSTYWCTPANPTFPVMGTLQFPMPAIVQTVSFNTMLPGYATSGVREVMIEAIGANGMPAAVAMGVVNMNSITPVSFPAPVSAVMLRLTVRSNYGGTYAGISELQVLGNGVPAPAVAPVAAGPAIQFSLGANPIAQMNAALAQANQAMGSAVGQANQAMASAAQAASGQLILWNANAQQFRGRMGQSIRVICPPGGPPGSIWGTGVYTDDSSICTAAVHAGRIQVATGGAFGVNVMPGMPAYMASVANGISSRAYPQYSGSFAIVP